jgi:hypothetical protein
MPQEWIYIASAILLVVIVLLLAMPVSCGNPVAVKIDQTQVKTYSVSIRSLAMKGADVPRCVDTGPVNSSPSTEFLSIPIDTLVYVWIDTFTAPPAAEASYTDVIKAVSQDTATFIAKNSQSPRLLAAYCYGGQALDADYRREYFRWKMTKQALQSYHYDTIRHIVWIDGTTATSTRINSLLQANGSDSDSDSDSDSVAAACLLFSPSYYDHTVLTRSEALSVVSDFVRTLEKMYESVNVYKHHPAMDLFIQHYSKFNTTTSSLLY